MDVGLQRQGKSIWGIKSPSIVWAIGCVFRFFPKARFVHLVRDGRDVVASLRTHPKYLLRDGKPVATGIINPWPQCVDTWVRDTTAGISWRSDPRYYQMRFEDLVLEPESTLTRFLNWLGQPFDPRMLNFFERNVDEGIDSHHPGLSMPIDRSTIGSWRTRLDKEAVSAFDEAACELLQALGYSDGGKSWISELVDQSNTTSIGRDS